MEIPEGFDRLESEVWGKDDVLVVSGRFPDGREFSFVARLGPPRPADEVEGADEPEAWGPPPDGFEWTGEVRPPLKGEYFWSEIKGQVVRAIQDETGVNHLGEATGGRRILRPVAPPPRPSFRLVK